MFKMTKLAAAVLMVAVAGALSGVPGVQAAPARQSTLPQEILQTGWTLQYFGSDAQSAGKDVTSSKITINFAADGTLGGFGGCNNYSGTYTVDGTKMTISDKLVSTMMACEQTVMDQESLYFRNLVRVNGYNLKEGKLDLIYADGADAMMYVSATSQANQGNATSLPAEVLQTEWILRYFNGNEPNADVSPAGISIKFEADGKLAGFAGCNNYNGSYTVSGPALMIPANIATTRMACPAGPTALETDYLSLLPAVMTYKVAKNQLSLVYGNDGAALVYIPKNMAPQVEPTPPVGMPKTGGSGAFPIMPLILASLALSLLGLGIRLRRRPERVEVRIRKRD